MVFCTTCRLDTSPKSQPIIENEEEFEDEYEEDIPFEINIQDNEYEEEELLEQPLLLIDETISELNIKVNETNVTINNEVIDQIIIHQIQ